MKTLYIECNMGAAGDMLLSALYELLEDQSNFLNTMNGLGLPGVHLQAVAGLTCGIAGTQMKVTVDGKEEKASEIPVPHSHLHGQKHHYHPHEHEEHFQDDRPHHHQHPHNHPTHTPYPSHSQVQTPHHHHATPGYIAEIIDCLSLPEDVKIHARSVYDAIAQAEAKAHGCPVGEVHFHEVGALDAVTDITGVCYALHLLGVQQVIVSPVHVGSGTVRCAHGIMPVPAPATAALLTGVPVYGGSVQGELCTPTGAALLVHFAASFGPMPRMTIEKVGVGIGANAFAQANCVRAFLGQTLDGENEEIIELTCNIDDMTPESLSFACSRLLNLGALDVYTIAGTMKKGRPGHILTVLCKPELEGELARHILKQTTTNGLRVRRCGKYFLTPSQGEVQTQWGPVRTKQAQGFGIFHEKPEFDDVAAVAKANHIPYSVVWEDALRNLNPEKGG